MSENPGPPNADMTNTWDGPEGEDWSREWRHHDRAVAAHQRRLFGAAGVQATDHVLDIGCGNGTSTRAAAKVAVDGDALGIDLSSLMLERAREQARAERLTNVTFAQADAQTYSFERAARDLAISRFGVMFFDDPRGAFANIRSALRPGGRFVAVVWRSLAENEWVRSIRAALALGRDIPLPPPHSPGPFGLADAAYTREVLMDAGFVDVALDPLDEPFWAGADADGSIAFFRTAGIARGMTAGLSESDRNRAFDALRSVLAEHTGPDGVIFGSGAWLISARNR
jgi:SAM-dependent methyltransferase